MGRMCESIGAMLRILLSLLVFFGLALAQGKVVVKFHSSQVKAHQNIRAVLSKSQYLKDSIAYISEQLKLPRNIAVNFEDCQEENAYYDPASVSISMCYELISELSKLEAENGLSQEDQLINATQFTLFHELGHALIHQFHLPITGKEEDAVDEFSVLALLKLGDDESIVSGILQFLNYAEKAGSSDDALWDSHSLDLQRMYDMGCIVAGKSSKRFSEIIKAIELPAERLEECPTEYTDARYAWNTILKPYLRNPAKPFF